MKKVIYLFRNDLRLHDQPVLKKLEFQNGLLLPVFCFDIRWFADHKLGFKKMGKIRLQFLLETVNALKTNLQNLSSDLLILHGKTEELISQLTIDFKADEIYFEKEDTWEEQHIEQELTKRINISIIQHESKTLLRTAQLPFAIPQLPDIFTDFRKKIEPLLHLVKAEEPPQKLPPFPQEFLLNKKYTADPLNVEKIIQDKRAVLKFIGGEGEGLQRLMQYIWKDKSILHYKETRNELIGEKYSSKFSPWLANGALSARKIFHEVKKFEKESGANESTYWLIFELLWRDYFRFVAMKYGKKIFFMGGIKNQKRSYLEDFANFEKWRAGHTGSDFVDANMTELLKTGYMSNRGRQNVASYFCNDLKIDWRWGAAWFESQLIDYDVASNWGNWMYIAGVGNDPRPNRYFDIQKQAAQYDPDKKYRATWLGK